MRGNRASVRTMLAVVAALACAGAAAIVIASAVSTSSARVAATTSSEGLLGTASVALTQPDSSVDLLLDADGLFPGASVSGCVVVEYTGTVPVSVRLHGSSNGSSALDAFVDIELLRLDGDRCPPSINPDASRAAAGSEIFAGRLSTFWARHGSYARGLHLAPTTISGDRIVVGAVASLVDDNRAQGLTTDFTLTVEARPT